LDCSAGLIRGRSVAGSGPVRAPGRAHQPDALHPVVPVRVRAGDRGPGGTAHLGLEDCRTPGIPAYPRRRDHHRATRSKPSCGRRNDDGRAQGARATGHLCPLPARGTSGVWEAAWSAQTVSRRARAERLTGWLGEHRTATAGLAGRLPHSKARGR